MADVLDAIRSRRVTRRFREEPVSEEDVRVVVEAGAQASSAGNRSLHRFLVVRDAGRIRLVRTMSPGMLGNPTALVAICTDLQRAEAEQVNVAADSTVHIDVGTAAMNMMLAAHALGLGSCPTTSFSRSGVAAVLELPDHAVPEFVLQLGRPVRDLRKGRRPVRPALDDVAYWERYGSDRRTRPP